MNFALALLRCSVGAMIIAHGYAHVFPNKIKGTAAWFGSMGMRPPLVQAWLASITEMGGGALLLAGLLTPLAAGAVLGVMAVAFVTAHRKNGFFIYLPGQGWEYVAMIAVMTVVIGTLGAGEWSLDNTLDISFSNWWGTVATLVVGIGGSAALLAACWRPIKK